MPPVEAPAARQIQDTPGHFDSTNYGIIALAAVVPIVVVLIVVFRWRDIHKHESRTSPSTADAEATPNQ